MRNIIQSMDVAERRKYDYDALEQKYLKIVSREVDDHRERENLTQAFAGKNIVLVAPGKSSLSEQDAIKEYIARNQAVVIAVNALLPGYDYDYAFFVNPARYDYARANNAETFRKVKKILLSNIKSKADENEQIINYYHAIKQGWPHFDNAVICALRLLDWLGIKEVSLAGFDGFRTRYNESYADPLLPTLNPDNQWDELNEEITEIFRDYKANAENCKTIHFLTPSYFDK